MQRTSRITRRFRTRRGSATILLALATTAIATTVMAPAGAMVSPATTRSPVASDRDLMVAQGDNFETGVVVTQTGPRRQAAATAASPRASVATPAQKVMRVAVVMMRLPGSTAEPVSKASVSASTFGASNSVADWYSKTSAGQVAVTGAVYGYYTGVQSCDLATQLAAAAAAAAANGYVASDYDHLVVYTPKQPCGWGGMGWIGGNGVFLNGTVAPGVMEHELGHNLGLGHAGAYTCTPATTGCLVPYGDTTDVMGNPSYNRAFSAEHKFMLGWIPASEVRTVSLGTATIALSASNPRVVGAIALIHVRAADGTLYAIDRRVSVGYDKGLSGVWIRKVLSVNGDDTVLMRRTALPVGASFVDAAHRVTVTTVANTGPTASVQVCVGECTLSEQGQPGRALAARSVATASRSASANTSIKLVVATGHGVAAGRTVVVSTYAGAAVGAVSCRDSRGNTYSLSINTVGSRRLIVCSAHVNTALVAGSIITVSYPRFRGLSVASAGAFSGLKASGRVDKKRASAGTGAAIDSRATTATTRTSELVFGVVVHTGTSKFTPNSPFSRLGAVSSTSGRARVSIIPMYKVVTSAASYKLAGRLSSARPWRAAVVTFFRV